MWPLHNTKYNLSSKQSWLVVTRQRNYQAPELSEISVRSVYLPLANQTLDYNLIICNEVINEQLTVNN